MQQDQAMWNDSAIQHNKNQIPDPGEDWIEFQKIHHAFRGKSLAINQCLSKIKICCVFQVDTFQKEFPK